MSTTEVYTHGYTTELGMKLKKKNTSTPSQADGLRHHIFLLMGPGISIFNFPGDSHAVWVDNIHCRILSNLTTYISILHTVLAELSKGY